MICLPLFADQFDNAQRLAETGFGVRIDPYNFSPEQLNREVDRVLNDQVLAKRLKAAAQRIQSTDTHEALANKIEQLLSSSK